MRFIGLKEKRSIQDSVGDAHTYLSNNNDINYVGNIRKITACLERFVKAVERAIFVKNFNAILKGGQRGHGRLL